MKIILSKTAVGGGREELNFDQAVIRFGRDKANCDAAFDNDRHPMVSRRHAELMHNEGRWFIVDQNSSYGTYLNGVRITAPAAVAAGDQIRFGTDGPICEVVWFEVTAEGPAPRSAGRISVPSVEMPIKPLEVPPEPPKPPARTGAVGSSSTRFIFVDEPQRPPVVLSAGTLSIGRDKTCEIVFPTDQVIVSRRHAVIRTEGSAIVIEDNESFNGTFINEQRITSATPLYNNDLIRLGISGPILRFDAPSKPAPPGADITSHRSIALSDPSLAVADLQQGHGKTMMFRLDTLSEGTSLESTGEAHLLMSLSFGDRKELTIGRAAENDISLDGLQISSKHARLLRSGSDIVIDDLGSTNGVFVNGERVSRRSIGPNDKVLIGSFEIRVDPAGGVQVFDVRSKARIDAVAITRDIGSLRLLDDISLTIQPNEFVGLLGPSGAGKSMLMTALNGVWPATSGRVYINNLDLYSHIDSLKQSIGYVPQDDIIHRELTVYRTLYYVAKLRLSRDVSPAEIERTIEDVLDVTGLTERREVPVSQLSGGQRKRVSIAVELITKPSIIFLDEPTSGLDPATEEKIMRLFRQIAASGRTVVLTTHAMENVSLFDKIVVLMSGRLVFFGPPADALKHLGAANYKELFDKLEAPIEAGVRTNGEKARASITGETAEKWRKSFRSAPQYAEYIEEPQRSLENVVDKGTGRRGRLGLGGSIRQWATLSKRYFEVLRKDKLNLLILFGQAPIIAFLTFIVLGNDLPRDLPYFVLAIVAIWFGTSVSAREIVRERPVYERERMVNLGLMPYVASKLTVLGIIVFVQCLLLFLPLKFLDIAGLMSMPGEMLGLQQFWTMILSAGVGIATGLLISALVRTSEMATSLVPLILIPQILFSGIFGVPTGLSKPISLAVPAAWSFDTMKRFSTLDTLDPEGASLTGSTGGQGLYRQVETENENAFNETKAKLEEYKRSLDRKVDRLRKALDEGQTPHIPDLDAPPPLPSPKKLPESLSGYITFLHPWMNEVLNQLVLVIMFGLLTIATMIVLRFRDIR